jgi:hypothetical protein
MSTKINTQVIVTESIICDVCHCSADYHKPLFSAGQVILNDSTQVFYGLNLSLNVYGRQVEHICPGCMKKVLERITGLM